MSPEAGRERFTAEQAAQGEFYTHQINEPPGRRKWRKMLCRWARPLGDASQT